MKRLILALLLCSVANAGAGGGYPQRSATRLVTAFCESNAINTPEENPFAKYARGPATWERRQAFCMGYVEATADAARSGLCLPDNIQTPELVETVRQWVFKNSEDIHGIRVGPGLTAAEGIVIALAERWPCPAPRFD